MKLYWIKTHWLIKKLFPKLIWDIRSHSKKVYLTFDDGPTPEITTWVLSELKKHNARATFFCIGQNIDNHLDIYQQIVASGHTIGNHTYNHFNGWQHSTASYIDNVLLADAVINHSQGAKLFRPPYGKLKPNQAKQLRAADYKIIMWDILSADFDQSITKQKCLDNVLSNIRSGSIIVFHDSQKAYKNLEYVLPIVLLYLAKKGFCCDVIK